MSERIIEFQENLLEDGSFELSWSCSTPRDWNRILRLIKSSIPPGGRAYDGQRKKWVIASSYVNTYYDIKQAVLKQDSEIVGSIDQELNDETVAQIMGTELANLPNSMRWRANFAIKAILGNIDTPVEFCTSEDRFAAWNDEFGVWFFEDGRYSSISPSERDNRVIRKAFKRIAKVHETIGDALESLDAERENTWKTQFRASMLKKYDYRCYACGRRPERISNLHMHRVIPGREGGHYIEDNVIILCVLCHRKHEGLHWTFFHNLHEELITENNSHA